VNLVETARQLADVDGVVGVVLGGSRARAEEHDDSDYDVGIYYRGRLDTDALRAIAADVADESVDVSEPGGWGPWVDGGAWLVVGGERVDWIYRHLDRVRAVWARCKIGAYEFGTQAGHPLGFASFAYAGELALARPARRPNR
jgi:predicted nucleotidyltransferase